MYSLNWIIDQFKKDCKNVPNRITLVRLFFGVFPSLFLLFLPDSYQIITFIFFVILILTDSLDGYYARKLDQMTAIGRIIDPIADRIIMGSILIVLIIQNINTRLWLSLSFVWFIVSAVIIFFIIRRAMFNLVDDIKPNISGKIKTIALSVLVSCLLVEKFSGLYFFGEIIPFFVIVSVTSSLYSFFEYIFDYVEIEMPVVLLDRPMLSSEISASLMVIILALVCLLNIIIKDVSPFWQIMSHYGYVLTYCLTILGIFIFEEKYSHDYNL